MFRLSTILAIWAVILSGFACPLAHSQEATQPIRVGIYDNRAIAVAFAASKYNPVPEKMKEYNAAKEAENTDRVRELEAWGCPTRLRTGCLETPTSLAESTATRNHRFHCHPQGGEPLRRQASRHLETRLPGNA